MKMSASRCKVQAEQRAIAPGIFKSDLGKRKYVMGGQSTSKSNFFNGRLPTAS